MKIILSRKGFDSSYGGAPSPILPDGTLISLPIPVGAGESNITYANLRNSKYNIGQIVSDLTKGKIKSASNLHLDSDLTKTIYQRKPGWRPIFGQTHAAQGHLKNNQVGVGDIFLFYGWFREVELENGRYRFIKSAKDKHVIFGWLQIGEIINVAREKEKIPAWAEYHPHVDRPNPKQFGKDNTLYIASKHLQIGNKKTKLLGGGCFQKYSDHLCLTDLSGDKRTEWKLPKWFYPGENKTPLSYHKNIKTRWAQGKNCCYLRSAYRGQEFVLNADEYSESIDWLLEMIVNNIDI